MLRCSRLKPCRMNGRKLILIFQRMTSLPRPRNIWLNSALSRMPSTPSMPMWLRLSAMATVRRKMVNSLPKSLASPMRSMLSCLLRMKAIMLPSPLTILHSTNSSSSTTILHTRNSRMLWLHSMSLPKFRTQLSRVRWRALWKHTMLSMVMQINSVNSVLTKAQTMASLPLPTFTTLKNG